MRLLFGVVLACSLAFVTSTVTLAADLNCRDAVGCPEQAAACDCGSVTTLSIAVTEQTILGETVVAAGSQVTPTGGRGPYKWEFIGGEIDATGKITSVNSCTNKGDPLAGKVTVTGACGEKSKDVQLSAGANGGEWKQTSCICQKDTYCSDLGLLADQGKTEDLGPTNKYTHQYPSWMQPWFGSDWPCKASNGCTGEVHSVCKTTINTWVCK